MQPKDKSPKSKVSNRSGVNASDQASSPEKPAVAPEQAPSDEGAPGDIALLHSATSDGAGVNIVRLRHNQIELGALRPLEHGKPIQGEVVRLKPRAEQPRVCDVEVLMPNAESGASASSAAATLSQSHASSSHLPSSGQPTELALGGKRKGPAQVATDRYRANWDLIWKKPQKPDGMLN